MKLSLNSSVVILRAEEQASPEAQPLVIFLKILGSFSPPRLFLVLFRFDRKKYILLLFLTFCDRYLILGPLLCKRAYLSQSRDGI